jgi:hypothetical protein
MDDDTWIKAPDDPACWVCGLSTSIGTHAVLSDQPFLGVDGQQYVAGLVCTVPMTCQFPRKVATLTGVLLTSSEGP